MRKSQNADRSVHRPRAIERSAVKLAHTGLTRCNANYLLEAMKVLSSNDGVPRPRGGRGAGEAGGQVC